MLKKTNGILSLDGQEMQMCAAGHKAAFGDDGPEKAVGKLEMADEQFITMDQLKDYVNVTNSIDLTTNIKADGVEIGNYSVLDFNTLNVSGKQYLLGGRIMISLEKSIKVIKDNITQIVISTSSPYTNFKFMKNIVLQGLQGSNAVGVRYSIMDILPNAIVIDAYYPQSCNIVFIYVIY